MRPAILALALALVACAEGSVGGGVSLPGGRESGEAVRARLGAPSFVRRDGPGEIWRYDGADCTLTLVLFQSGNGLVVDHAEARGRGRDQTPVSPGDCSARIARGGRAI